MKFLFMSWWLKLYIQDSPDKITMEQKEVEQCNQLRNKVIAYYDSNSLIRVKRLFTFQGEEEWEEFYGYVIVLPSLSFFELYDVNAKHEVAKKKFVFFTELLFEEACIEESPLIVSQTEYESFKAFQQKVKQETGKNEEERRKELERLGWMHREVAKYDKSL
jgi:hypothetical protein